MNYLKKLAKRLIVNCFLWQSSRSLINVNPLIIFRTSQKQMPSILGIVLIVTVLGACVDRKEETTSNITTICNPLNLSYRFQLDEPSRREAADPTVVFFQDEYYLFASKSGGYWYSANLSDWIFVATDQIPTEDYAPTALAINDTMYFMASSNTIYKATDLKAGKWELAATLPFSVVDPALFLDDDKRLYFYWGCSDKNPTYGVELDYKNGFALIDEPIALIHANTTEHGWEVPGDYNTQEGAAPWIEGSWMNKHNGKYYLQYAGPGTQFKSYSDGVYTSENPLGPFTLAENNPFAYRPEGFASGAGHGSTFEDKYGNFWHIGTVTISQKHMFERRLALFPTFFDRDGVLHADTRFGDYPFAIPTKKISLAEDVFPGWMLLSYQKPVTVSSTLEGFEKGNMVDENIRTYWSAKTGNGSEWAMVDLEKQCDVMALQINFAEQNTTLLGRTEGHYFQYQIEASTDNNNWKVIVDKSQNEKDYSHDYIQLEKKEKCRYLRIKNRSVPDGNFALCGFRVFGNGMGAKPEQVNHFSVIRDPENKRTVHLSWNKLENTTGYQIRYGTTPDKLYQTYQVYQDTSVDIHSLNSNLDYYFTIESFNENGCMASDLFEKAN